VPPDDGVTVAAPDRVTLLILGAAAASMELTLLSADRRIFTTMNDSVVKGLLDKSVADSVLLARLVVSLDEQEVRTAKVRSRCIGHIRCFSGHKRGGPSSLLVQLLGD
jgi:hypothetical protein